jgi:hypothetical protein
MTIIQLSSPLSLSQEKTLSRTTHRRDRFTQSPRWLARTTLPGTPSSRCIARRSARIFGLLHAQRIRRIWRQTIPPHFGRCASGWANLAETRRSSRLRPKSRSSTRGTMRRTFQIEDPPRSPGYPALALHWTIASAGQLRPAGGPALQLPRRRCAPDARSHSPRYSHRGHRENDSNGESGEARIGL